MGGGEGVAGLKTNHFYIGFYLFDFYNLRNPISLPGDLRLFRCLRCERKAIYSRFNVWVVLQHFIWCSYNYFVALLLSYKMAV